MSLIVEDGTGVYGADCYTSIAVIDTYWTNRPHSVFSATWLAGDLANKEGAARETCIYLDANFGRFYLGTRMSQVQGLQWPRTAARDKDGFELLPLPPELIIGVCELAARALSNPLVPDATIDGVIKRTRQKVDVLEREIEYAEGAYRFPRYSFIAEMLDPILNGSQPGAAPSWHWL